MGTVFGSVVCGSVSLSVPKMVRFTSTKNQNVPIPEAGIPAMACSTEYSCSGFVMTIASGLIKYSGPSLAKSTYESSCHSPLQCCLLKPTKGHS